MCYELVEQISIIPLLLALLRFLFVCSLHAKYTYDVEKQLVLHERGHAADEGYGDHEDCREYQDVNADVELADVQEVDPFLNAWLNSEPQG